MRTDNGKRIDRAEAIEPIDVHVGTRIRAAREMRGWSRRRLSEEIGMSEQQITKWEAGLNRVYCGRLYALSCALGMEIPWFFQGFMSASMAATRASAALGTTPEGLTGLLTAENVRVLEAFDHLTATQKRLVRQIIAEFQAPHQSDAAA